MDDSDFVWVSVRVSDGSAHVGEYRGQMAVNVFQQITSNELNNGWFALESVSWERDREEVLQSVVGVPWGYGDTTYFRIENLLRIIPLSDSFVQKRSR